jgi:hypothetical protein
LDEVAGAKGKEKGEEEEEEEEEEEGGRETMPERTICAYCVSGQTQVPRSLRPPAWRIHLGLDHCH